MGPREWLYHRQLRGTYDTRSLRARAPRTPPSGGRDHVGITDEAVAGFKRFESSLEGWSPNNLLTGPGFCPRSAEIETIAHIH